MDGRDWRDGRAQKWHFTFEQQFWAKQLAPAQLSGRPWPGPGAALLHQPARSRVQLRYADGTEPAGKSRPDASQQDWNLFATNRTGYSNTHSLQAEFEKRYSSGLLFQTFYTFTRALTTSDSEGFSSGNGNINSTRAQTAQVPEIGQILGAPQMSYDDLLRLTYYNNGSVPPHRVRWNGVYDLPFGKGRHFGASASGFVNQMIGGWQLSTIGDWRSGNWLGVAANRYLFGDPTLSGDERLLLNFGGRPNGFGSKATSM